LASGAKLQPAIIVKLTADDFEKQFNHQTLVSFVLQAIRITPPNP
jgi:hypothetical protein